MSSSNQDGTQDATIERLRAVWIHRMLSLAVPWAVALMVAAGASRAHAVWGGHGVLTLWAVVGLAIGVAVVTFAAWHVVRHRPRMLRAHSAVTALAAGGWLCIAVVTGPAAAGTGYLGVLAAVVLCLTWNFRRHHPGHDASSGANAITELFAQAAEPAGMKGARMSAGKVIGRKVLALIRLVPGEQTSADLVRRLPNVESGMKLPPGSLTAVKHDDRADHAVLTLSDPRVMRKPIPWPGPSNPSASIAKPITPGLWQDTDPVEWIITGHHVQLMGMTGSGKGFGGAWGYLGEVITRDDVAVFAADITKGDQTLGPLRPALHRLATNVQDTRALLSDMRAIVRPRTDYLASRGLQKWEPGCGLTYLIVWLEECPDILDRLTKKQMEEFESLLKAMRSAGMSMGMSLQRSTYDQMPTILRGQLANWCFGVSNSSDAKYGLSERQEDGGAEPERWQSGQPGMAYLDAPGIPDGRIAMPMRCFWWGDDASVMAAHAARFPASSRALDPLTARLLADAEVARNKTRPATPIRAVPAAAADGDDEPEEDEVEDELEAVRAVPAVAAADDNGGDPDGDELEENPEAIRAEYLTEPDPDPGVMAGIDDPIEPPGDGDPFGTLEFPPGGRLDPAQARARFRALLAEWIDEGRQEFSTSDLYGLLSEVGMSRSWLHKQINLAVSGGLISPVTDGERGRFGRYELAELEPAPAPEPVAV